MAEKHKKNKLYFREVNLIIHFIVRVIKFLAFQSIFRIRNIKFLLLKIKTKEGILIKKVQGSKMRLDLKDEGISKDLVLDGIREPESTKEIKKIVKPGDVVVEAGANIGYYALMESQLVGKKGKVYAIEPIAENVKCLKNNIKLNNYPNIEVFQIAIGEKEKMAKMHIASHSNWNSFINHRRGIIGTKDIKVTSLDNFLKNKRHPNLIRMDVEGYEYNIIKGMKNTLKSKRPLKLFIELHPHIMKRKQTEYLLRTLAKHGFETKKVIRSVTVPEMKVMSRKEFDFSSKTINDLLKDDLIISGKKGAFEIFFERK